MEVIFLLVRRKPETSSVSPSDYSAYGAASAAALSQTQLQSPDGSGDRHVGFIRKGSGVTSKGYETTFSPSFK